MDKADLKKYIPLKKEAEELRLQAEQLRAEARGLKAVVIDGMPNGGGVKSDSIGNAVARLDEIERDYIGKYDEALCELHRIERVIESLENPTERRLMRKRYIEDKSWEDICVELNYSWRQVHRTHAKILKKL